MGIQLCKCIAINKTCQRLILKSYLSQVVTNGRVALLGFLKGDDGLHYVLDTRKINDICATGNTFLYIFRLENSSSYLEIFLSLF